MSCTIAYKKHSVGVLYIALTALGCVFAICSFITIKIPEGIIASIITVISAVLSVMYLSLPSDIIVLTDNHTISLPHGVCIPLESIVNVSYSKVRAKGVRYKWGKIKIYTVSDSYRYNFVCDCEKVAKQLISLVEAEKRKSE